MMGSRDSRFRRLDFGKLTFSGRQLSTKEALKDVTPIKWPAEVCNGKKKIAVSAAEKKEKK